MPRRGCVVSRTLVQTEREGIKAYGHEWITRGFLGPDRYSPWRYGRLSCTV